MPDKLASFFDTIINAFIKIWDGFLFGFGFMIAAAIFIWFGLKF